MNVIKNIKYYLFKLTICWTNNNVKIFNEQCYGEQNTLSIEKKSLFILSDYKI